LDTKLGNSGTRVISKRQQALILTEHQAFYEDIYTLSVFNSETV